MNETLCLSVGAVVHHAQTGDLYPVKANRVYRAPSAEEGRQAEEAAITDWADKQVKIEADWRVEERLVTLSGRIDAIEPLQDNVRLVEVKATRCAPDDIADSVKDSHTLQLEIYAQMWWKKTDSWPLMRVIYVDVRRQQVYLIDHEVTQATSAQRVIQVIDKVAKFSEVLQRHRSQRQDFLTQLKFPYAAFRPGQRELAAAYYLALRDQKTILSEVPTGAGKTLTSLFSAAKFLAQKEQGQVFYYTAKRSGAQVAEDTLRSLLAQGCIGLRRHARAQLCSCDGADCKAQVGYYDRLDEALKLAMSKPGVLGLKEVLALAEQFTLCPAALQADLTRHVDFVVADFNALFRYSTDEYWPRPAYALIDEVHNLPDRARSFYSAQWSESLFGTVRKEWRKPYPKLARLMDAVVKQGRILEQGLDDGQANPKALNVALGKWILAIEQRREKPPGLRLEGDPLTAYFQAQQWLDTMVENQAQFSLIKEPEAINHFCALPSDHLSQLWHRFESIIAFSGTLVPLNFFAQVLGLPSDTALYRQPSPFSAKQLEFEVDTHIKGDYKHRASAIPALADRLALEQAKHEGRWLVAVPSFAVGRELASLMSNGRLVEPGQSIADTLADWSVNETIIAPLGGTLTEGVDYPAHFLAGVCVFSIGMPSPSDKQNEIAQAYLKRGWPSFEYAYQYVGIGKVVQAAGRLIRSAEHSGKLLLVDHRWQDRRYRGLLPQWWFDSSPLDE